jgi:hypothetical protein
MHSDSADMKSYIVLKSFHLGEVVQNLSSGDTLKFDGNNLDYKGRRYNAPSLQRAIAARLVVEDDGSYEVRKTEPVAPARPKPKVVVENMDDNIVGKVHVQLPDNLPATTTKTAKAPPKTPEQAARAPQPRQVVVEDQKIVGVAKPTKPAQRVEQPAGLAEQNASAKVVNARVTDRAQQLLEAEGVSLRPGVKVVADASEGVVVGRVKSLEEREEELRRNQAEASRARAEMISANSREAASATPTRTPEEEAAFQADLQRALARRPGQVSPKTPPPSRVDPNERPARPAATKTATTIVTDETVVEAEPEVDVVDSGKDTLPAGYPQYNQFSSRVEWLRARLAEDEAAGTEIARRVYRLSNDRFKAHLAAAMMEIDFE